MRQTNFLLPMSFNLLNTVMSDSSRNFCDLCLDLFSSQIKDL